MNIRYKVTLTAQEQFELRAFVQGGSKQVRRVKRAQILLAASTGAKDEQIARNVSVGTSTVFRTKRRFVEEGLEAALSEEPRPGGQRKLSAKEEALLVATACPGRGSSERAVCRACRPQAPCHSRRATERASPSAELPGTDVCFPWLGLACLVRRNKGRALAPDSLCYPFSLTTLPAPFLPTPFAPGFAKSQRAGRLLTLENVHHGSTTQAFADEAEG